MAALEPGATFIRKIPTDPPQEGCILGLSKPPPEFAPKKPIMNGENPQGAGGQGAIICGAPIKEQNGCWEMLFVAKKMCPKPW